MFSRHKCDDTHLAKTQFSGELKWLILSFWNETLPNFIKRKHPRKGEKKKQKGKDHTEVREPLSTETSTNPLFSPLWW
jgi:hypothetical protein